MHTCLRYAATATVLFSAMLVGGPAHAVAVPGDCNNDSKSLGAVLLSNEDVPGTWWFITREGLDAAGITTQAGQQAIIELAFGQSFATFEEATAAVVAAVPGDRNGNGYVCASPIPRTGDGSVPLPEGWQSYFFNTTDDKHV